jgi:hydroxymethylpyrimidine pyrophosphatase-like HAD family hydrolase
MPAPAWIAGAGKNLKDRRVVMTKLVLLDVDKTIIDEKYRLPVPRSQFVAAIARAQDAGIIVGLNSDSALPTVLSWAQEWGIKGPLLAEQSVLHLQDEDGKTLPTQELCAIFRNVRDAFVRKLIGHDGPNGRFLTVVGDVNSIIGHMPSYTVGAEETQTLVAVNGLRQFSLSFFVRQRVNGRWSEPDDEITRISLERVSGILCAVGERFNALWPSVSLVPDTHYGICIAHHKDTHKRTPVIRLLNMRSYDHVYMVGDSDSDYLNSARVTQCAVGNASESYKRSCQMVATKAMAAGVMELLEKI